MDVQDSSAAYAAGLRNGDRIMSIDSYHVNTLTYEAILDIVRKAYVPCFLISLINLLSNQILQLSRDRMQFVGESLCSCVCCTR